MIYIGSDHAGFELKEYLNKVLKKLKLNFVDVGAALTNITDDYPDYVKKVAKGVQKDKKNRGIVICGTGIGSCIAANKFKGIRAALPYSIETAKLSRLHNNSNVLCLGGRTMPRRLAKKMMKLWLNTDFSREERHIRRIKKIEVFERGN